MKAFGLEESVFHQRIKGLFGLCGRASIKHSVFVMHRFLQLLQQVEIIDHKEFKAQIILKYFQCAATGDAAWAVYFLWGRKLEVRISPRRWRKWLLELSDWPEWMIDSCQMHAGNLSESVALMLPQSIDNKHPNSISLQDCMNQRLRELHLWDERVQLQLLRPILGQMNPIQRSIFVKFLTVGIKAEDHQIPLLTALAQWCNLPTAIIERRLSDDWQPSAALIAMLKRPITQEEAKWLEILPSLPLKDEPAPGLTYSLSLSLILTYAIEPNRRRAGNFCEYAFAAHDASRKSIVTVTKAISELNQAEKADLDRWIKSHPKPAKGPIHPVTPKRIYKITFTSIQPSKRHKCGYVLENSRIIKSMPDMKASEAASIQDVAKMANSTT